VRLLVGINLNGRMVPVFDTEMLLVQVTNGGGVRYSTTGSVSTTYTTFYDNKVSPSLDTSQAESPRRCRPYWCKKER
jgi:hypothetical protein